MDILQIFTPPKSFELSKYHPYCSIHGHKWTCFKCSLFTPQKYFELSTYHPYCNINGHKWTFFNFFHPTKIHQNTIKSFMKLFKLTSGYPPRCRETMKENYFAMKANGIRWRSWKNARIFSLGPIFYVCSSARNWVPFMYNYYIRNSLWGVATLDVWSS
jgi:hypothetical protein